MIAPSGPLSEPLAALRAMIAASPAFMAWTQSADREEATARAHLMETTRNPPSPYALISFGDGMARERAAVTNQRRFDDSKGNNLLVYFHCDAVDGDDEGDAIIAFANAVGAIWTDLELAAGIYEQRALAINEIELTVHPTRIERVKQQRAGNFFEAVLTISYTRQP